MSKSMDIWQEIHQWRKEAKTRRKKERSAFREKYIIATQEDMLVVNNGRSNINWKNYNLIFR